MSFLLSFRIYHHTGGTGPISPSPHAPTSLGKVSAAATAKRSGDAGETIVYNSAHYARAVPELRDPLTGEVINPRRVYYPRVDVTVTCGNGISKTPGATVEVLEKLSNTNVTEENWQLLAAMLDYLDIPQKQDIVARWRARFAPGAAEAEAPPDSVGAWEDGTAEPVLPM